MIKKTSKKHQKKGSKNVKKRPFFGVEKSRKNQKNFIKNQKKSKVNENL